MRTSRIVPNHTTAMSSSSKSKSGEKSDFTISDQDRDRIIKESGILEKLPPDFIPFDPTNKENPFGKDNPFVSTNKKQSSTSKDPIGSSSGSNTRLRKGKERIISTSNNGKIQEFVQEPSQPSTSNPNQTQNQWSELITDSEEEEEEDSDVGSDTSSRFKVKNSIDDPTLTEMNAETLFKDQKEDSIPPHVERFLDLIIWTIPLGFLYVMLDVMIHQQYAQHPTAWEEFKRVMANIPSESLD